MLKGLPGRRRLCAGIASIGADSHTLRHACLERFCHSHVLHPALVEAPNEVLMRDHRGIGCSHGKQL